MLEIYGAMRATVRLMARVYLAGLLRIHGAEQVPRSGGLLVCANHASTIDPPLVGAFLPRGDSWSMAKAEFFARASLGRWVLRHYHAFPVVRHSADRRALRRATTILRSGQALIMYPEGYRVAAGGLQRGEPGAGFLARLAQVPVLPVALVGTRECVPRGGFPPRRVRVEIRFLPPIRIRDRRPDGRPVANQEGTDAIMLAIAAGLPAPMRGVYADLQEFHRRLDGVWTPAALE